MVAAAEEPRRAWLEAVGLAIASTAVLAWPQGSTPSVVVGDALGETDNHLWMFWRALSDLPAVANLPEGVSIPLMDPFNLLLYGPGSLLGPVAGWWCLVLGNLLLAHAGGYALARCFAGHKASLVGMVGLGAAPVLAGLLDFGITENWPVGLLALHLAALIGHARTGTVWTGMVAGVLLGLVALCGWYFAFFGVVLSVVVVPALLWKHRRVGLLLQGGLALAMVLPRFVAFRQLQGQWDHRWYPPSPVAPGPLVEWRDLTVRGTDLLNLVLPHPEVLHPGKSSYLGLTVLLLVAIGIWKRPRVAVPLAAGALPFLVLALGYWPTVAGTRVGIPGLPWVLVKAVPSLLGLSHWERSVVGALPFFAAAAAVGVDAVPPLRRWAVVICGVVVVDSLALSGAAWPRGGHALAPPPGLSALPGRGGVIQVPFDNGREPFSREPARLYNRWQVAIDRPVAENYEGPDALLVRSRLVAAAHAACRQRSTLPPYYQPPPEMRSPPPPEGTELLADSKRLVAWGYDWIVLHRARCAGAPAAIQLLERTLGGGRELSDGDWAWAISPDPPGEAP